MKKRVVIVGTGPGGLTAGMILAHKGYDVRIFEIMDYIGGRNSSFNLEGYIFDLGPTFLMMKFILEEMFELAGKKIYDYLDLREIEPMYRLVYSGGREFFPSSIDKESTVKQIGELFPGDSDGYWKFIKREKKKFDKLVPCLQVPYDKYRHLLSKRLIKASPFLDAHISIYKNLGRYFDSDDLKIAFTFQAKYLGMSPWECPGSFSIISFIEHNGGIWHPIGGLNQITKAMAKVCKENGASIYLSSGVKKVLVKNGKAVGVKLLNGEIKEADYVIVNTDFGYAVNNLFDREVLRKWTPDKLKKKKFSCSTFMIYLGVDRIYDNIPHHNIIFADDYRKNVHEIAVTQELSAEPSVYIQNASVTDSTLAPQGKSTIYLLVPVPNLEGNIDWDKEAEPFKQKVLDICETKGKLTDLRKHIEVERVITPPMWETDKYVYKAATFNLAHNIGQMLIFRPHNKFDDVENCFLVGGGTHPGSGLPTIFESGRISSDYIMRIDGIK
ncbi:phytoene desaturase [bacterium]|nr:phytoene desaturase [bacterium]